MKLDQLKEHAQSCLSRGRPGEAVDALEEICRIDPQHIESRFQIAAALEKLNQYDKSTTHLQHVVELQPDNADAWAMLANINIKTGRPADALVCSKRALAVNPGHVLALLTTGISYAESGQLDEAEAVLTRAIEKSPLNASALVHLARVFMRKQLPQRAESLFIRARETDPQLAPACVGYGNSLLRQGKIDKADRIFMKTCEQFPDNVALINQIGNMYRATNHLVSALQYYKQAVKLQPDSAEILSNIANIQLSQGQLTDAENTYKKAIKLKPDFWQAHSNLVLLMNYLPETNGTSLLGAHRAWGERHTRGLQRFTSWSNSRSIKRPLRIGYVSPDFHHHPVSAFVMPILKNHDPEWITSVCFSDSLKVDTTTGQLQQLATKWHSIKHMSDEQLINLIRSEQIDILVDLAGHTSQHRLRVFARKPAPVQINYLGYPATSGLVEMDYRLTDTRADPPDTADKHHTEELVYIPSGFLCYQPDRNSPEIAPLPCDATGTVTFGSLNNLSKINKTVVSTWSSILNALPGSRIIIKNLALSDLHTREYYIQLFESHGINRDRIELRSHVPSYAEHLDTYNEIDIGLDTFPYNGTTTTCEALWMGVPVITLKGRLHAGRVGYSLLSRVQLPELVSEDREDYIQAAIDLAKDQARLRFLRKSMQDRVAQSTLCDGPVFTRELETIYTDLWKTWCLKDKRKSNG